MCSLQTIVAFKARSWSLERDDIAVQVIRQRSCRYGIPPYATSASHRSVGFHALPINLVHSSLQQYISHTRLNYVQSQIITSPALDNGRLGSQHDLQKHHTSS